MMKITLSQVSDVALVFACVAISALAVTRLLNERPSAAPEAPQAVEDVTSRNWITKSLDVTRSGGSDAAHVVLIEFSDFQCPYCGKYARETFPRIWNDHVLGGQVKYEFRNLPLPNHQYALGAARSAECAGKQRKYWDMHERIFENQTALTSTDLIAHAKALGLDTDQFEVCLDSADVSRAIESDLAEASRLSIVSTPTFLVGIRQQSGEIKIVKKINGAQQYDTFKKALGDAVPIGGS